MLLPDSSLALFVGLSHKNNYAVIYFSLVLGITPHSKFQSLKDKEGASYFLQSLKLRIYLYDKEVYS
jgi:hypothetical protein